MAMHRAVGSWEHEASLPAGLLEAVAQSIFDAAEKTLGAKIAVIAAEEHAETAIEAVHQTGDQRADAAPKGVSSSRNMHFGKEHLDGIQHGENGAVFFSG
ncbi:hypothetical protein RQ846_18915 [Roseomonas mucosa]|nr:hypothetical protein [Roseomonas mucosa]